MDLQKTNEIKDLKNFMLGLRSGGLLKLIESNQVHFQDKYNAVALRAKQSEEELSRQRLIIKQNSNLIEKFQNQLQELSNENVKLLEQQQVLSEDNVTLREQLQCSEEKFAQLDVAYDQQVSLLSERIQDLEAEVRTFESIQHQDMHQFDQAQTELHEKIAKTEKLNEDLKQKLQAVECQQDDERTKLKAEVTNLNTLNTNLQDKIKRMEQETKGLHKSIEGAMSGNKHKNDLQVEINKLRHELNSKLLEHQKETYSASKISDELKSKVDELKKKLLSKEQELEEVYIKFKELSRIASAFPEKHPMFGKYSKRSSTDDPKTIDNSSDSDSSSISFYKPPKTRKRTAATDDESAVKCYGNNLGNKRRSVVPLNAKANEGSSVTTRNQPFLGFQQHIVIPESPYSPVVSSSALTNPDQQ